MIYNKVGVENHFSYQIFFVLEGLVLCFSYLEIEAKEIFM